MNIIKTVYTFIEITNKIKHVLFLPQNVSENLATNVDIT